MGAKSSKNTTQNNRSDGHLLEYFRNTFIRGGGANASGIVLQGLTATGGVISDYNTPPGAVYRAHIFTSSGTFDVSALGDFGSNVEYLVVGGGGGTGTRWHAGGGGAGGLLVSPGFPGIPTSQNQGSSITIPATLPAPFSVTIGAGGAGATGPNNVNPPSGGNPSSFGPVSVDGGGYGGTYATPGGSGGSGGGGGGGPISPNAPATNFPGPTQQGFPGGRGDGDDGGGSGGGGGGAGGSGQNFVPPNSQAAHGGLGLQVLIAGPPSPTFTSVGAPGPGGGTQWFAGGGGVGLYSGEVSTVGQGGGAGGPYAGGGPGGTPGSTRGVDGGHATGGGGGGPAEPGSGGSGSNGGSGIVVVRYQIAQLTATAKATGGAISYYNGKTIHTFTSSGTFASLPTWSPSTSVEYVVVGGGGAAGQTSAGWGGGGGGAGGYLTGTTPFSGPFSFAVNVGAGGAYRVISTPNPGSLNIQGPNGTNSTAAFPTGTITSYGGGGGGKTESPSTPTHTAGSAGGSGGGGSGQGGPGPAPYTPPQGNPGGSGGDGISSYTAGGGGGGAGGGGTNAGSSAGGSGGTGVQVPTTFRDPIVAPSDTTNPVPYQRGGGLGTPGPGGSYYLAGGGGGAHNNNTGGAGGAGGGGKGGGPPDGSSIAAVDGVQSTGGGGGGIGSPTQTRAGGGGSGIVLIAYPS